MLVNPSRALRFTSPCFSFVSEVRQSRNGGHEASSVKMLSSARSMGVHEADCGLGSVEVEYK